MRACVLVMGYRIHLHECKSSFLAEAMHAPVGRVVPAPQERGAECMYTRQAANTHPLKEIFLSYGEVSLVSLHAV